MKLKGRKLLKKLPQVCYFMPSLSLSAKWAKLEMKLQNGRPVQTILLESGLGKEGLVFKNFVFASWEINGFPMAFSTSF
jgi:hypothetical protein